MIHARPRRAALAVPIAATVLALSIAGCGGGGGSASTTSASADAQQFQDCLKQQGVKVPSGGPPTGTPPSGQPPSGQPPSGGPSAGVNPQKMQKAFAACQQYAPQGAPSGGFPSPPGQQ
jgi:hypothetical protein